MAPTDLVAVKTLHDTYEVELALGALRAANVEAFAKAQDTNRPYLALAGVTIFVREEDAQRARDVLGAD